MESLKLDLMIYSWYPCEITSVFASDGSNFHCLVDENTVLRHPDVAPGEPSGLDVENENVYRTLRQGR